MAANYLKLWKLLLDKDMRKIDLKEMAGISNSTLAKLGKSEYISMECMARICKALGCDIGDIMSLMPDVSYQSVLEDKSKWHE